MSKTIVSQMHDAKILLTNVQQPDLSALIAPYGYDATRIAEGQALYDNAIILLDAQQGNYANQYQSTRALYNQAAEARLIFSDNVLFARRAFGTEKEINDLGVGSGLKRTFEGWTDQAHKFYATALGNPDIMTALARFGATTDAFQANLLVVDNLRALSVTQKDMIGNAQVSTERKNDALKALLKWCADLIVVCRVAFRKEPQHLERLGKIVYSPGYKPKKNNTNSEPEPEPQPEPEPTNEEPVVESNEVQPLNTGCKNSKRRK